MYVPAPADVPDEGDADGAVGGEGTDGADGPADNAGGAGALDTPVSEADMTVGDLVDVLADEVADRAAETAVEEAIAALDDGGLLADPEAVRDGADDTPDDAGPAVDSAGGPRGYQ